MVVARAPLDPLTQDACAFYQDHGLFDDYTGVVLDTRRASASRRAGDEKAVILRNHGLLTVGHPSTKRSGGSSPWSARARRSCSPRRPARRSPSNRRRRASPPSRWAPRGRLVQLPAVVGQVAEGRARPVRLIGPAPAPIRPGPDARVLEPPTSSTGPATACRSVRWT